MDGDGREVLFDQELGQGDAALHRLDEDDHLPSDASDQVKHVYLHLCTYL